MKEHQQEIIDSQEQKLLEITNKAISAVKLALDSKHDPFFEGIEDYYPVAQSVRTNHGYVLEAAMIKAFNNDDELYVTHIPNEGAGTEVDM